MASRLGTTVVLETKKLRDSSIGVKELHFHQNRFTQPTTHA